MSWFSRRGRRREPPGPTAIASGPHNSPGLATLIGELEKRSPPAILDLGPSSTENVEFLSAYGGKVLIQDLFRSSGAQPGSRTTAYRFEELSELPIPGPDDGPFDTVLIWDLLHYFDRGQAAELLAQLVPLCAPGALVLVMASAIAPIPATPIQFKIDTADRLLYTLHDDSMVDPPNLRTRDIELLMRDFRPLRSFQLRNGLQEFVFTFEGKRNKANREGK